MALVIAVLLCAAGIALLFNVGGAADALIRRVTSRSLGELAPGYAASRAGLKVYAVLVLAIGVAVAGLGIADWSVARGGGLLALGVVVFLVASVIAIAGEVRTYRALKP
ncbi:MAG: hypothetical protein M3082_07055 [Candidatus Dormibacteraeota bacterium]|nr:hypothetical protein [Candidatus Dormibacteraeota bacterium]